MYNVRITDKISSKLTVYESYLYYCLALCTDFNTMESNAKQETIARMYYDIPKEKKDISNFYVDKVRKYLHTLEYFGFISISKDKIKGQFGTFEKCKYNLSNEHFFMVSNKLYNEPIKKELKGFLILLKSLTLNGTNLILYTLDELEKELKYSRRQISTYIKELKEFGYLQTEKKGISIVRDDLFPLLGSKAENYKNIIETFLSSKNPCVTKSMKQYIEAKKNNFRDIENKESFFLYVITGVPFKRKNKNKIKYEIVL